MRNSKRIEDFLVDVYLLWNLYPDLRFGQLVDNLIPYNDGIPQYRLRLIEDDDMLALIHEKMGIRQ